VGSRIVIENEAGRRGVGEAVKALLRILYSIYSAAIRGTRNFLRMYSSSMRRDLAKMSDRWLAVNISTSQELYPLSMICISPQGSLHANAAERQSYNLGTCRQRYEILWFQCPVPTSISLLAWRVSSWLVWWRQCPGDTQWLA
jgi:hypothetical protein